MNPPFLKSLVGGAFAGFRMLHTKAHRQFGEVRSQRLVLEAWDRLFGGGGDESWFFVSPHRSETIIAFLKFSEL